MRILSVVLLISMIYVMFLERLTLDMQWLAIELMDSDSFHIFSLEFTIYNVFFIFLNVCFWISSILSWCEFDGKRMRCK